MREEIEAQLDKFHQPGMESFWISDIACPACNRVGLFLGNGGYITCSQSDCPNPDYAESSKLATERAEVEGQLQIVKRILAASDAPKNKGFSGTWHGNMAAACGEVAVIYKELQAQLRTITTLEGDSKS